MAQTATSEVASESRFGLWSMWLFTGGIFGPFIIALIIAAINGLAARPGNDLDPVLVAVWFAFAAQVLAFIFGILGRSSRAGRIGLWGSSVLLALVVINGFLWFFMSVPPAGPGP